MTLWQSKVDRSKIGLSRFPHTTPHTYGHNAKSTIKKKTVTSKKVSDATIKKAAARDLAFGHCKGYMQGCGAVVSRSTRWRHREKEKKKHGKQIQATLLSTSRISSIDTSFEALFPGIA
jgi:hypothetical protein